MTSNFKETEIGLIPKEWNIKALPDILSNTVDNRGKSAPLTDTGIPLIATNCIKETGLYPTFEKIRFVSKDVYDNWFRDHPKTNDIIIVNKGTPGLVCLVPKPVDFCIAQDMIAIRANEKKIYYKFLFAYLRSPFFKHQVDINNVGTTIPHLKKTWFSKLFIPIPSYPEQKLIGDLYYNLSKKIDLNQKINQTLESLGQAIFKHWFVDFEFPDENGNPYKSSGGEMVDSELGEIPKGWEVSNLGNFITIERGLSYKGRFLSDTGLPMLNLGTFSPNGGFKDSGLKYYSGEFKEKNLVKVGDIIIANTDITQDRIVLGSPCIVPPNLGFEKILFTHHIYAVRNNSSIPNSFLYYLLKLKSYKSRVEGFATGTTVLALPKDAILKYTAIFPEKKILVMFEELINLLWNKININNVQNNNLSQIRDSILPKLMSGKIRVNIPEEVL